MKEWLRSIPHPSYGKWCGAENTHEEWDNAQPIDGGDAACRVHDFELSDADKARTKKERRRMRKLADKNLKESWRKFKPSTIKGKLYRLAILIIF